MKFKFTLALITIFISPIFNSCNSQIKINTLFGIKNINNRKLIELNKTSFETLMNNNATFILIQTTTSCHCSTEFTNIVNNYIAETGLLMYSIDINEVKDLSSKYNISFLNDSPTFHVILKGSNQNKLEKTYTSINESFFTKYDEFKSFIEKNIAKPSLIYINENELDNLYQNDDKFVIYFAKSDCKECSYLTNILFNNYGQSNLNMKTIYVLDYKDYSEEDFNSSRIKYGLNQDYNSKWGYLNGTLPMIYTINPKNNHDYISSIDQGFTFGNDILINENNQYKVVTSFYSEERNTNIKYFNTTNQIDKVYSKDEVIVDGSYYTLNKDSNINNYQNYFNGLMSYINNSFFN